MEKYLDSRKCFDSAIAFGYLDENSKSYKFAGNYMYMHSVEDGCAGKQIHFFKHIDTRRYIKSFEF